MEGCPRSSMLSIDLKDSIPAEFTDSLKKVSDKDHSVNIWSLNIVAFDEKDDFSSNNFFRTID